MKYPKCMKWNGYLLCWWTCLLVECHIKIKCIKISYDERAFLHENHSKEIITLRLQRKIYKPMNEWANSTQSIQTAHSKTPQTNDPTSLSEQNLYIIFMFI